MGILPLPKAKAATRRRLGVVRTSAHITCRGAGFGRGGGLRKGDGAKSRTTGLWVGAGASAITTGILGYVNYRRTGEFGPFRF